MFLTREDLKGGIYEYQVEQITEGDENITLQAMAAAEEEARSYLTPNVGQKEYLDGRLLYDVDAIFGATGLDRNALILQHTVTLAKWHIVELCNADVIYEQAKDTGRWIVEAAEASVQPA